MSTASGDAKPTSSLFRIVWRWHFYAGVIVSPILMVVAITGGLYIFGAEIDDFVYRETYFVPVGTERLAYQDQLDAVAAAYPDHEITSLEVSSDPARATKVGLKAPPSPDDSASDKPKGRRGRGDRATAYVDPYTGSVVGLMSGPTPTSQFFQTILQIHRNLFTGKLGQFEVGGVEIKSVQIGRVIVELSTCWTIVLLVTGLYLWWPRRREKIKGVLVPRLSGKFYTAIRDLHALTGAYLFGVAIVIASTGLVYTWVWGDQIFQPINNSYFETSESALAKAEPDKAAPPRGDASPPEPSPPPTPPQLTLTEAIAVANTLGNGETFTVNLPTKPGEHYTGYAGNDWARGTYGRMVSTNFTIDRDTGEVREQTFSTEQKYWWHGWTYPLHVGSVFGPASKVVWLLACVALALLPVTGMVMWWKRRPGGKSGFPRRPRPAAPPLGVWTIILLLSVAMPLFGLSVVLVIGIECLAGLTTRTRPRPAKAA